MREKESAREERERKREREFVKKGKPIREKKTELKISLFRLFQQGELKFDAERGDRREREQRKIKGR